MPTTFLDQAIQHLIREGIITEDYVNQQVRKARETSPMVRVHDDSESIGLLVTFLMQHDESMSTMLALAMSRIAQLEDEVRGLKNA